MRFIIVLMSCMLFLLMPLQSAKALETMQPDYSNLRGLNYLPSYVTLSDPYGTTPLTDVSNPVAMWRFYDMNMQGNAGEVNKQLGYFQDMGVNAVRVWMSLPAYQGLQNSPNGTLPDRFAHFLNLCYQQNIWVIPVLWGGCQNPVVDYTDPLGIQFPHDNLKAWMQNPGAAKAQAFASNPYCQEMIDYLNDIICIGMDSGAVLMWDVMNEPRSPDEFALVDMTLNHIKSDFDGCITTVGVAGWDPGNTTLSALANNPNLDILSFHPYGMFRENMEQQAQNAADLAAPNGKPIIANEFGDPGKGELYQAMLNYATNVPYMYGAQPKQGVGFCLFWGMIGAYPVLGQPYNYPFVAECGMIYRDGQVRSVEACNDFWNIANSMAGPLPPLNVTYKAPGSPNYVPQYEVPESYTIDDVFTELATPVVGYNPYTQAIKLAIFSSSWESIGYLASTSNPVLQVNPVDMTTYEALNTFIIASASDPFNPIYMIWNPVFLELLRQIVDKYAQNLNGIY